MRKKKEAEERDRKKVRGGERERQTDRQRERKKKAEDRVLHAPRIVVCVSVRIEDRESDRESLSHLLQKILQRPQGHGKPRIFYLVQLEVVFRSVSPFLVAARHTAAHLERGL